MARPQTDDAIHDIVSFLTYSWAKSTIFINAPVSALLKDAGNIPVDRKNKDNQKLFSGTFEALKLGEAVAIFPEGTSYTEPRLQEIKDGASWVGFLHRPERQQELAFFFELITFESSFICFIDIIRPYSNTLKI